MNRRQWLAATLAAGVAVARAASVQAALSAHTVLDREQSRRCRDWMTLLIRAQIEHGPNPRWNHRDCAGLVRFAVDEALRPHDVAWKRANGFLGTRVPADVEVGESTLRALRQSWRRSDGTFGAFAPAIDIVQENTRFVSRDLNRAEAADLMFFDMGDEQHLMVWMGHYIAYHTGRIEPGDNGLRALRPAQLYAWKDTRWRPTPDNPNFVGIYSLDFLA